MNSSASRPALVSVSKAPEVYGLSRSTVYRLAERGDIDVVKVGRSSFIVDSSFKIEQLPKLANNGT